MEEKLTGLSPELLIHPGETLQELLEDRGMEQSALSKRTGFSEKHIGQVMAGNAPVTESFARALEVVFGVEASFWLNLQSNYEMELLHTYQ